MGTNYTYYVVSMNTEGAGPSSTSEVASPQAALVAPDNTMLYVGVIIVVLVVVVAAALIMRGRKK